RTAWQLVRELQADGVSIVLTTHLLDEAEDLADDVVIIHRGRVMAAGTPGELGASPLVTFTTDAGIDRIALGQRLGREVTSIDGHHHHVVGPATPAMIATLAVALAEAEVTLTDLSAGRRPLEAVFLELTDA